MQKTRDKLKEYNEYFVSSMVDLIDMYLGTADSKLKISHLNKMIEHSKTQEGKNNELFCMEFLINEYRSQGNYQKVAEYQGIILKSLGYRSFFEK